MSRHILVNFITLQENKNLLYRKNVYKTTLYVDKKT